MSAPDFTIDSPNVHHPCNDCGETLVPLDLEGYCAACVRKRRANLMFIMTLAVVFMLGIATVIAWNEGRAALAAPEPVVTESDLTAHCEAGTLVTHETRAGLTFIDYGDGYEPVPFHSETTTRTQAPECAQ